MEVGKKASGIPLTVRSRTRAEKLAKLKSSNPRPNTVTLKKKHNCLCVDRSSNRTPPGHSIKSQSMVELVSTPKPPAQKKHRSKELEDESFVVGLEAGQSRELGINVSFAMDGREAERAKYAYCKLVLNAWRKRRQEVAKLGETANKLKNRVDNQAIQIIVLRDMFEYEKLRVAVAMGDSAHLRDRFEEELKSNKKLSSKIASLLNEKTQWRHERENLERKLFSLESELKLAHEKISQLNNDCFLYQADISTRKATETELSNKIGEIDTQLEQKISIIEDLREKSTSLQCQVKQLFSVNKSLYVAVNKRLKELSECKKKNDKTCIEVDNLKNTVNSQRDDIQNLTRDYDVATGKVESQRNIIEELKSDLLQYELEKQEFKDAMKSLRNQIIFGAIKASAKLFLPVPLI